MKKQQEWICTDQDTEQYGRQLNYHVFDFREGVIKYDTIDLKQYQAEYVERIINSYNYTLYRNKNSRMHNIFDLYPNEYNWIIAECIFESENN